MKPFVVIGLALASFSLHAQDLIYFTNGTQQNAKVLEVGTNNIVYKKADNPDGPTYVEEKNKISMIEYANGSRDVLGNNQSYSAPQTPAQNPQYSVPNYSRPRPQVNVVIAPPMPPVVCNWGVRYYQPVVARPYHHRHHQRGCGHRW